MMDNENWHIKETDEDIELYEFLLENDPHIPLIPNKQYKIKIRLKDWKSIYGSEAMVTKRAPNP